MLLRFLAMLHDGLGTAHRFFADLGSSERAALGFLAVAAAVLGFVTARMASVWRRARDVYESQNEGESLVSDLLFSRFAAPDYHLMNHVTLRMKDGTTQIDHILVSRFGVFVIETKHLSGWIFADASDAKWTQVLFRQKFRFQNPIFQNHRHVVAVRELLDFLPPEAIKSLVVFTGNAEFKTPIPADVTMLGDLCSVVAGHDAKVISLNRLQFCVGRLETARLAVSRRTDVEHIRDLARRYARER
jgi:Nuclease-related domain